MKRRWARILKGMAGALVLSVGLGAAAYKNWIPGGPEMVEAYERWKNVWHLEEMRRTRDDIPEGAVVFLGASSVQNLPVEIYYPHAKTVNLGLAMESAPALLARLGDCLPSRRPSGIVLMTGANDLRVEGADPPVVAERVLAVADALRAWNADVPVAIVEILPTCLYEERDVVRLRMVNDELAILARQGGYSFVRVNRPPLVNEKGQLVGPMALQDQSHLNFAGYGILAPWIAEDGGEATRDLRAK